MKTAAFALAASLVAAGTVPVLADPRVPVATEWNTDHGHVSMTISGDHSRIDAVWTIVDGDSGQIHLQLMAGGIYSGYWLANKYFKTCKLSRYGYFYWGNISMIFDSDKGIFAAKDDFCGKYKDEKFEVWKGVAESAPPPAAPVTTAPPAINAPNQNGPATNAPVTNGPNMKGPINLVKPDLLKLTANPKG
jgi:hypothetical protein